MLVADYDFDDFGSDDDDDDEAAWEKYEKEKDKSIRKLKSVIDDRVQFWVDCIQTSVPGAVILPVATFDDYFDPRNDGGDEAKRRCKVMVERLKEVEKMRVEELEEKVKTMRKEGKMGTRKGKYLRDLFHLRPKIMFPEDNGEVIRVSCDWLKEGRNGRDSDNGFERLRKGLVRLTKKTPSRNLFPSIGSPIGNDWENVRQLIRDLRR